MVLYVLSERLSWNSEISSLDSDVAVLSAQAQKTADYADNYNTYSALYDSYSNDWDTVFAYLQTYNDNLALVLEELEDILPEKTSVTNIQRAHAA